MSAGELARGRRPRRRLLWFVLVGMLLLLVVYLGVGAVAASQLSVPRREFYPENAAVLGAPYQDVRFPARTDGVEIAGWYVPRAVRSAWCLLN